MIKDCNGREIEIGDTVTSPPNASDPVCSDVIFMWKNWPWGEGHVVLASGNELKAHCLANDCRILKKKNDEPCIVE